MKRFENDLIVKDWDTERQELIGGVMDLINQKPKSPALKEIRAILDLALNDEEEAGRPV